MNVGSIMHTQKISISLPENLYYFVERYQTEQHYKSRSQVITTALRLLQKLKLETCYRAANDEIDSTLENTAGDGIDADETW